MYYVNNKFLFRSRLCHCQTWRRSICFWPRGSFRWLTWTTRTLWTRMTWNDRWSRPDVRLRCWRPGSMTSSVKTWQANWKRWNATRKIHHNNDKLLSPPWKNIESSRMNYYFVLSVIIIFIISILSFIILLLFGWVHETCLLASWRMFVVVVLVLRMIAWRCWGGESPWSSSAFLDHLHGSPPRIPSDSHTHTLTHIYIHTHTYTPHHRQIDTTHTHTHTDTHTHTHTHTHTNTNRHTHTHTHTQTKTHTHTPHRETHGR